MLQAATAVATLRGRSPGAVMPDRGDVDPSRRGLVMTWWSFTATFTFLRVLTWLIHIHAAGLGNVSAGSVHLRQVAGSRAR